MASHTPFYLFLCRFPVPAITTEARVHGRRADEDPSPEGIPDNAMNPSSPFGLDHNACDS